MGLPIQIRSRPGREYIYGGKVVSTHGLAHEIESCLTDAKARPTITPEQFSFMPVSSVALDLLLTRPERGRWIS